MRIVITGGLGYIGASLVHRIAPRTGCRALVIDNRSSRDRPAFPLPPSIALEEADICLAPLLPLFADADAVLHLAAVTDAAASVTQGPLVNEVNVAGTRRVAEACLRTGAPLLFVSTTSVYSGLDEVAHEDGGDHELRPQSPYAASKLRAEAILQELGGRGLRYAITRFGSVFGQSMAMRVDTAINRFCWQAVRERRVSVWRTALHQRRPYLHVDDAVGAMLFALAHGLFDNRIYNVVSVNTTVDEILRTIRGDVAGLAVRFVDSPIMNELSYAVSTERLRTIGLEPAGDLSLGIRDTLRVLRQRRSSAA